MVSKQLRLRFHEIAHKQIELTCVCFRVAVVVEYLVYLRTTPEVVYERMKARGRSEETSVSLDYLKQLHDLHEDWLIRGLRDRPADVCLFYFLS